MGARGYNAGGFAYMPRVACRHCGRKFPIGGDNGRRTCNRCFREGKPPIQITEEEARQEAEAYRRERIRRREG